MTSLEPRDGASHPAPPGDGFSRPPVGRPGYSGPGAGPTSGVDLVKLDYIDQLSNESMVDLFRLAGHLRYVLGRQGKRSRDIKTIRGCSKFGALLALNDARRPRLSTLLVLADEIGVPRHVMLDIAEACPAAIAPEGKGKSDD